MSNETQLFSPFSIRSVTLPNRIVLSPLCMYSANSGMASSWQFAHLSTFARGGVGLVFAEATAIEPRGRITPRCLGIWTDEQAEALKPTTEFIASMGSVPGLQIAHAGRKASAAPPWAGGVPLEIGDTAWGDPGWQTVAPSAVPLADGWQAPHALSEVEIAETVEAFAASARRALVAGFKVLEIHGAHGYLIHSFLSSLSNQRNDAYGGDLAGRMRFALEVTDAVRAAWPEELPLFFRLSAVDGHGWEIEDSIALAAALKARGVDVVDCSAGGITGAPAFRAQDDGKPLPKSGQRPLGFQVPYAAAIREKADIPTMAVGRIVDPQQAEDIVVAGSADLIAIGRELMHDPFWALHAAEALDQPDAFALWPDQYRWAIVRRAELGQYERT
ncbi:MAG: NADH:flavin oxidoreductase / NADH oxidase [Rhodospirillaceae bacterium]|nr:NADH:flavin oxidoreductase / NADH oxidase [Rhodospirillaceae bacterium]|tara:strand:+ start:112 stop:1275 length:1164 start_codon:yes stop_codon:yes gene_type:complete